jgi:DNA-binding response OmpR family regulator
MQLSLWLECFCCRNLQVGRPAGIFQGVIFQTRRKTSEGGIMGESEEKIVLVVDDEPEIVFFLRTVLEDHGFQVMTAFNGQEAIEKVGQQRPDLISLDLVMPQKSGIRFFHELRKSKEWSKIPVLFVTGHVRETIDGANLMEILKDRTLSGPATYLEKPVNAENFIRTVEAILGVEASAPQPQETGKDSLKQEVESLLREAPPETLQDILRMLRK